MKINELIKLIEKDSWYLVRTKDRHRQFHHQTRSRMVTIAGKENIDVPAVTLDSVLKQAGLKK